MPVQRSPRLVLGLIGVVALVLACLAGPLLLPMPSGSDPVRASLRPPGTAITTVLTRDHRVLASPWVDVDPSSDRIVVRGGRRPAELARDEVISVTSHTAWLGTDRFGRDVLGLMLRGGRISLAVAGLGALLALVAGSLVGLVAASSGRVVDSLLMRAVDGLLAFPILFLVILISAVARPGAASLVLILGLSSWMGLARLVRGQVLTLRTRGFVLAARAGGCSPPRIWAFHYLPNMIGPMAQDTALRIGDLVIAEATLSYLGLGIPPTIATWGAMVAEGHTVMLDGWWLATFPGIAIAALVISLALIGDGLQELSA
jgi:peptide/nickel transport system permease protein